MWTACKSVIASGPLFDTLVSVVRPLGTVALVGFAGGQVPIRPGLLLVKEVNVVGSLWGRYANEYPQRHAENLIFDLHKYIPAFEIFRNNQGSGNTVIRFLREDGEGDRDLPVNPPHTGASKL